eukprot:SAG25_NODE_78_length_16848_cov_6.662189_6_plen_278_part_00
MLIDSQGCRNIAIVLVLFVERVRVSLDLSFVAKLAKTQDFFVHLRCWPLYMYFGTCAQVACRCIAAAAAHTPRCTSWWQNGGPPRLGLLPRADGGRGPNSARGARSVTPTPSMLAAYAAAQPLPLLLLLLRAGVEGQAPASVAAVAAAPAHGSGNGTLSNPFIEAVPAGSIVDGSGTGNNYGPDERKWWRISPCREDEQLGRPCRVLLWFADFVTAGNTDTLAIFDGPNAPPRRRRRLSGGCHVRWQVPRQILGCGRSRRRAGHDRGARRRHGGASR